ncbi:MAG: hypothetical protein NC344_10100 [Bacteroidales bacterium]|nr:hypothetical protein [Bacteroidales bacterium]MCM1148155.1 hypothetical protein [Bacteroidales bacterium]MCM1207118.1 hypothetical protein [Bacillota bacterium]MCM1510870.1 hypothetical protein [Clostridium sp.]
MAKQLINRKETNVTTQGGIGRQYEQIVTVDDNLLPSPKELEEYKNVDPRIISFLLDSSTKEQEHRHKSENEKLELLKISERRVTVMNW